MYVDWFVLSFLVVFSVSSMSCLDYHDMCPDGDRFVVQNHHVDKGDKLDDTKCESNFEETVNLDEKTVNVEDYVNKGDRLDDTQGFKQAWNEVCNSTSKNVLLIPKNKTYNIKRINFTGPCNSLVVKMEGRIIASNNFSDYEKDRRHWIIFEELDNLKVKGKGTFDGNGKIWWQNSCKVNRSLPCVRAPTAVTFKKCNNLTVEGVRFENSQQMHLTFQQCVNVRARKLRIQAPKKSPNTDGIHITGTRNIWIDKPHIRTGDDCISIVNGSTNVKATNIRCGPGHGISIGSLGKNNSEAQVSNVLVKGAKLRGTTNGVRIKSWQGGKGYAKNIVFKNIIMHNVSNPIIIDQNYCDQVSPCPEQKSAVEVENIVYKGIRGTSNTENVITFNCSSTHHCKGIHLQDIKLTLESSSIEGKPLSSCNNVDLTYKGTVSPKCT